MKTKIAENFIFVLLVPLVLLVVLIFRSYCHIYSYFTDHHINYLVYSSLLTLMFP